MDSYDLMLAAIVGFAGLKPTLNALKTERPSRWPIKKRWWLPAILLCRKAVENRAPVIPVDSEHSAIFQCLVGKRGTGLKK